MASCHILKASPLSQDLTDAELELLDERMKHAPLALGPFRRTLARAVATLVARRSSKPE